MAELLQQAEHPVVMTGAGMSTESGLPDFRSNNGLWNNRDPAKLASIETMQENWEEFFSFYHSRIKALADVLPNSGHEILAEWEKQGVVKSIITQNVDGLHQAAGNEKVGELHGSIATVRCHSCGEKMKSSVYLENKTICPECGGLLRPNIVLFGEMLPEDAIAFAQNETAKADLFIVLGSSLSVTPASFFPADARDQGANLVIVNRAETEMDQKADLLLQDQGIGSILTETNKYLT
ncbi:NAD-dependent protein deacylase [Salibacterium salarium]|uniref:protein acetyllysine N-acetyltransferase n=1 Tax=Salibacterium salarium TaxID=284579 RepID=A0A428MVH5_9BACI|nr:NAD-dependent protein deacylase [Salibacterium salarium]